MRTSTFLAAAGIGAFAAARYRRSRRRISFRDRVVVITGGSRGLGLELARRFADESARLVLLARDEAELARAREMLDGTAPVSTYACDVRDRQAVQKLVADVLEAHGTIDVLVNNAGVIQVGPVEHMQVEDFENAMAVHTWGPLYLMLEVIPHMRRRHAGRIVNIASIGGLVGVPHLMPYVTSKFALVGLSDSMRAELAEDGIRVTTVAPGLMRTGSHVNALFKGQHRKEFAWFALSAALPVFSTASGVAARKIVEACRYGEARLIITPQAKLLHAANAFLPGLTSTFQKLAGFLLPDPTDASGDRVQKGWESQSPLAPSPLTEPADRAIAPNNEQNGIAFGSPGEGRR